MKKWTALVLTMALLVSIAPLALASGEQEPIVVTFCTNNQMPDYFSDVNEIRILREKFNIELKPVYTDAEKKGVMISSGDLTDIVICSSDFLSTVLANKMALALDPYLDNKLSNLGMDVYDTGNNLIRQFMSDESGQLYFMSAGRGVENAGSSDNPWYGGYFLRWDLYAELGYPEINSDEDYLETLKKMVEIYPVTEEGRPVYAMAIPNSLFGVTTRSRFDKAIAVENLINQYMVGVADGVLVNGYTNTERSAFWKDMVFYNAMWNAGIADPDSFTMSGNERTEKGRAKQYVASWGGNSDVYDAYRVDDPKTIKGVAMVVSANRMVHAEQIWPAGWVPGTYSFINAKSKNIDAALTVMNYFMDPDTSRTVFSGEKGVTWDYDENGVPYIFDWVVELAAEVGYGSNAFVEKTGIWGGYWEFTPWQATSNHPDGSYYNLFQIPKYRAASLNPLLSAVAAHYGYDTPGEAQMALVEAGQTVDLLKSVTQCATLGMEATPSDISRILTTCDDILWSYVPALVMAESEAEFLEIQAQVLDEIKAADEQVAWEWVSNQFNHSLELVQPYIDQAITDYLATK